jgi:hypothetical protein
MKTERRGRARAQGSNLHLIYELVLEKAAEHHADEQPLRHRHSRGAPKVRRIEVHGDGLAGHLRGSCVGDSRE